jgi:hypothetical protein
MLRKCSKPGTAWWFPCRRPLNWQVYLKDPMSMSLDREKDGGHLSDRRALATSGVDENSLIR